MSQYVSTVDNNKLSFNALEISCHALEKHCDKLIEEKHADLIVSYKKCNILFLKIF